KLQEQVRIFFANSNDNIDQLLNKEIPNRFIAYSRQCYIDVATCLQKRAYDTTSDTVLDMQKQLEKRMFPSNNAQQGSILADGQLHTSPSTLDRSLNRNRQIKNADSNESVTGNKRF
ncbi:unnamed protein product, partial [Adineta steineri]